MESDLLKIALEQVPALTVVGVLLYLFLKAFERVMDKFMDTQKGVKEMHEKAMEVLAKNNVVMEKYEEGMQDVKEASATLARVAQMLEFTCHYPRNL
jgi:uncharacterized protein YoxC